LLYRRLLHKPLGLLVQGATLGGRGFGHCPEQRGCRNELLARSPQSQRVIDVVVVVDVGAGLSSGLTRSVSAELVVRIETGAEILRNALILHEFGLRLTQLRPSCVSQPALVARRGWVGPRLNCGCWILLLSFV
jgi:hypothetical protein